MDKEQLKNLSPEEKREWLKKLASGKFILGDAPATQEPMTFMLQEDGTYCCKENGKTLTPEEIQALPGNNIILQLVGSRDQVAGKEPASGYVLVPYSSGTSTLDALLRQVK